MNNTQSFASLKSQLDDAINAAIGEGAVVGAVALIERRGEILLSEAYGYADRDSKTPMREDSIFRVASMSKPITSALALMLIEDGLLDLDTPIDKWIPELSDLQVQSAASLDVEKSARSISVRDLLTHRSGIAYPFSAPEHLAAALREATGTLDIVPDCWPDEWIAKLGKVPLLFQPGQQWHYGYSTDVLGVLLSRVAGCLLGELMQRRIFSRLAMNDTGFYCRKRDLDRMTTAYVRSPTNGELQVFDPANGRWSRQPAFESGGAGLVSTTKDYLQFARFLLRSPASSPAASPALMSRSSIELMKENFFGEEDHARPFLGMEGYWRQKGFGLGLSVTTDAQSLPYRATNGEFNWPGAFGTYWFAAPEKDLIGLLYVQEYWGASQLPIKLHEVAYALADAVD
ncbi:MAG TPA: serine hydrolase domain-containing protein [Spongiibacteraceae bacterium]|nr:serine hydrolase domain-containing protein [Spongiibacteraceae bacterium]